MAQSTHSFDVASNVDFQEVDNAVNQALKEVGQRYDLKDAQNKIELNQKEKTISIESADDYKVQAVIDILKQKLIGRGISPRALKQNEVEASLGARAKCKLEIQVGISKENAKIIVKDLKESDLKIQTQIQDDQIRVIAKKIDDLQAAIQYIKEKNYSFDIQFMNYR